MFRHSGRGFGILATTLATIVATTQLVVLAANHTAAHDRAGNRQAERDEYRDPDEERVLAEPGVRVIHVAAGVGVCCPGAKFRFPVAVRADELAALVLAGHVGVRLTGALAVRGAQGPAVGPDGTRRGVR